MKKVVRTGGMIEPMESRRMLALTLPLNPVNPRPITQPTFPDIPFPRLVITGTNTLQVIGSPEVDDIRVTFFEDPDGTNRVRVSIGERQRVLGVRTFRRIAIIGDDDSRDIPPNPQQGNPGFQFRGGDRIRVDENAKINRESKRRFTIFGDGLTASDFDGNDTITGTSLDDVIFGGGGIDLIDGGGGNDNIDAGDGSDTITGGDGDDTLFTGADSDGTLNDVKGNAGNDSINGNNGKDILEGNEGADTIDGGFGNDSIRGGIGNDLIRGGGNADLIYGELGNDTIFGERGDVQFKGVQDDTGLDGDEILGGEGNDVLWGEFSDDAVSGEGGNDTLLGQYGTDKLAGGSGNDYINGHEGNDNIRGGGGVDSFNDADFTPAGQTDFKGSDNQTIAAELFTAQPFEFSVVR